MKTWFLLFIAILSLQFSSCSHSGKIEDISWIIGQWQGKDVNELVFHENWERDGTNSYTGSISTTTPDGDTIYRETLKINLVEGKPYFVSTVPGSKGPVLFEMTEGDAQKAVFENREHSFPQSISYNLESKNHMNVKLEGIENGQPKVEHLEFERVTQTPLNTIPDSLKRDTAPKEIKINL
jgi:hypothetical protein